MPPVNHETTSANNSSATNGPKKATDLNKPFSVSPSTGFTFGQKAVPTTTSTNESTNSITTNSSSSAPDNHYSQFSSNPSNQNPYHQSKPSSSKNTDSSGSAFQQPHSNPAFASNPSSTSPNVSSYANGSNSHNPANALPEWMTGKTSSDNKPSSSFNQLGSSSTPASSSTTSTYTSEKHHGGSGQFSKEPSLKTNGNSSLYSPSTTLSTTSSVGNSAFSQGAKQSIDNDKTVDASSSVAAYPLLSQQAAPNNNNKTVDSFSGKTFFNQQTIFHLSCIFFGYLGNLSSTLASAGSKRGNEDEYIQSASSTSSSRLTNPAFSHPTSAPISASNNGLFVSKASSTSSSASTTAAQSQSKVAPSSSTSTSSKAADKRNAIPGAFTPSPATPATSSSVASAEVKKEAPSSTPQAKAVERKRPLEATRHSTRERKPTQRSATPAPPPVKSVGPVSIPAGSGQPLSQIAPIAKAIDKHKSGDVVMQLAHRLLFGRVGDVQHRKEHLRKFNGYPASQDVHAQPINSYEKIH